MLRCVIDSFFFVAMNKEINIICKCEKEKDEVNIQNELDVKESKRIKLESEETQLSIIIIIENNKKILN